VPLWRVLIYLRWSAKSAAENLRLKIDAARTQPARAALLAKRHRFLAAQGSQSHESEPRPQGVLVPSRTLQTVKSQVEPVNTTRIDRPS
jgi:hypothetical protein